MVALWDELSFLLVFSFLFLVVSCSASLFLSFVAFSPASLFLVILRGCFLRSLRCLFLVRCLVPAFFFPFSGSPFLALNLSFCSASSAVSGCLSVLFLQLVLVQIYGSLSIGASRSDEFMILPCISPAFCFEGFVLFLRCLLVWFRSFFCGRLFFIFLRSFCLVHLFPSSRASLRFYIISFPQGPPLGGCVLLLGFWLVCPFWFL